MSDENNNDVIVMGKPADYAFFPGEALFVSRSSFVFTNKRPKTVACEIVSCSFIENDSAMLLDDFYVYAGDESLGHTVSLPPLSEMEVQVTFPFRPVHVGGRFRYAVQIDVVCDGRRHTATSNLDLTQERPAPSGE